MAVFDCGASSIIIVSNLNPDLIVGYTINGVLSGIPAGKTYNLPCTGMITTEANQFCCDFKLMPFSASYMDYSAPFSLLAGLITALTFVVISLKKW